ncbi:hypothetical protein [Ohtaekwangia koreensis]|uniref:Uncharacterized protein n=1 Tax=Ohtaekwangia koreensis TaxID=688867 RepID=A0A1T5KPI3_9BACT|nr:hypothetical protein [Ohtaekwangia koreensis]SKC65666.1 hypothetical protein SAMN05660236_2439 [Ohtaekwangia koreensis]
MKFNNLLPVDDDGEFFSSRIYINEAIGVALFIGLNALERLMN